LRRLSLILLTILTATAAPAAPAAPAPRSAVHCLGPHDRVVTQEASQWRVCLIAHKTSASVGRSVTFTAETNIPLKGDRELVIVDVTDRDTIEICDDRLCTVKHVGTSPGKHKYTAAVIGLKGKVPRSKPVYVTWAGFDLELSAYATGRGPETEHPALLCSADDCGTNHVGLDTGVTFYIHATKPIPPGFVLRLEEETQLSNGPLSIWPADHPAACSRDDGCAAPAERNPYPYGLTHTYIAAVYAPEKGERIKAGEDRRFFSNKVSITWLDWTPAVTFDQGTRTCNASGGNCLYKNATLTANLNQELQPGVVAILYFAKGCVPQPGDPAGDPGCNAFSPKNCSPGVRVCTWTGDVAAGYQPGAVVVHNTPRPMLVYGSSFLASLP
jgi:hypothetical protein